MRTALQVGFYGKLPSHGDFLRRRVSDAFVRSWDAWLQACVAASQAALGERWLEIYLTSPAWRFASAGGACSPEPVLGVMAPSVDRVGRYYPLAVVAELPRPVTPLAAAGAARRFFESAERLVVETLATDLVDFARFDEAVAALAAELPDAATTPSPTPPAGLAVLSGGAEASWQLPIGSAREAAAAFEQLLAEHLAAVYAPLVIWCTEGSSMVEPSALITRGLPHPDLFAGMLDGDWRGHQWACVPVRAPDTGDRVAATVPDAGALVFRSAGASHPGRVRRVNQDAFLERPEVGVWAVADGLGGLRDGEGASRMVCDALADFAPGADFEDAIEDMRARLAQVNDYLVRAATRPVQAVRSGSTVVALLARGGRCAVVWAGDSRLYRRREGRLEALTCDHALDEAELLAGGEPHAVTRAIGGEETLLLDVHTDRVRVGDRYLLCSDGLTRTVSEADIGRCLAQEDIQAVVPALLELALGAGAPDNVTALVVEARRAQAP